MIRRPVSSSNIASIGWGDNTLEVEFHSGHVWQYHDVSEERYQALVGASSVGKHFNEQIKGRFEEEKIR